MARTTSTTTTPAGGTGSSTGNNLNFDKYKLYALVILLCAVIGGAALGFVIDQMIYTEPLRKEKKELQKQLESCQAERQEVKNSYNVCASDLASWKVTLENTEDMRQMWRDSALYLDSLLLQKDSLLHQKDSLLLQKDSLLQDCRKGKQDKKRKKIKQKKIVKQGVVEDKKITENVTNCDTVCTTTMYIIRRRSYQR